MCLDYRSPSTPSCPLFLGLAATHFLSSDPENIAMKRPAQYYLAKTVTELSTLVLRLDMETAEPVMLVAMFIVLQTRV